MHGHRRRNLTGLVVLLLVGALSAVGCSDGRDVPALSDGRYAAPLGVLEEAVADVQRSAANVPSDSDAATWLPLVRDDLETAAKASASVTNQIGATCPSA